jgi:hypothetical protein
MFKVSEARIVFRVDKLNDEGAVEASSEVPIRVFEAQFTSVNLKQAAASLIEQVEANLAKANGEKDGGREGQGD